MTDASIFDFPIARRTDQFDRLAAAEDYMSDALSVLEDYIGATVDLPIVVVSVYGRFPVHDLPMDYYDRGAIPQRG